MNANLHHLELFYYVAKAKGISNAVKIIPYGIRQPAISQQIKTLEEDVGAKLFERMPFTLTPAGKKLFKFVSRFFDNIDSELRLLEDDGALPIRIVCPAVVSAHYLPALVRTLLAKFPHLRPSISEADGTNTLSLLSCGDADVAITFAAPSKSRSLNLVRLLRLPMTLVVPEGHRFCSRGCWPQSDFAAERWIALQESSGGVDELREGLSRFGVSPEFSVSTNSIDAAIDYVEMGLGIALMARPPESVLNARKVRLIPDEENFGSLDLSVAWPKNSMFDPAIFNFIAKTAKSLAGEIV